MSGSPKSTQYPICVLSGGWGEPWEVEHGEAYAEFVLQTLVEGGYKANIFHCDSRRAFCAKLENKSIVYNCLFGRYGEDGTLASVCELLQVSYTGSRPLAAALSMDKARCRAFLSQFKVRAPETVLFKAEEWSVLDDSGLARLLKQRGSSIGSTSIHTLPRIIVKPNQSSFASGVTVMSQHDGLRDAFRLAGLYSGDVIVQEFIDGMTVFVPVLCGRAMTPVEVVPFLIDGELPGFSFRSARKTYLVPARLQDSVMHQLCETAEIVHKELNCNGLTRSDFRVSADNKIYFLELNSQHSIRPTSVALMSGRYSGLSALMLVERILEDRWLPR